MKEGFFRNYELAQLPPLARILFQGLWCLADKEGRLWDRPEQIKVECLPYDDCNVTEMLSALASSGFIVRYEVARKKCIQVVNFEKHQVLTSWEKSTSSEVPPQNRNKSKLKSLQSENEGLQIENDSRARDQNRTEQNRSDQIRTEVIEPPFGGDEFLKSLQDFESHRKEIRKPLHPTGRKKLYKQLSAMGEARAIVAIEHSIAHGWQGVFEPQSERENYGKTSTNNGRRPDTPDTFVWQPKSRI